MEQVAKRLGIYDKMEQVGLDAPQEILTRSVADLQKVLNINESKAHELLNAASADVFPWSARQQTALDLSTVEGQFLTTNDPSLDKVLGGGIHIGTVTEVVGESSSGKTQLCLQLCLTAQKPIDQSGLGGTAVYLHSEGHFPIVRLEQLVDVYASKFKLDRGAMKRSIHTMKIIDSEQQYRLVAYQLPAFLERYTRVRLVVIDSIGASYRGEPSTSNDKRRFDRMTEICDIGARLKKIAQKYRVAVVVVNQVSDVPSSNNDALPMDHVDPWMDFAIASEPLQEQSPSLGLFIQSLIKKPILGLAWSNAVTTRIRLARSPMSEGIRTRRVLFVEFCPFAARNGLEIQIDERGVHKLRGRD
ncbi:P-loop containing nucleoside triphosphate hydrolase protein [Radiomyces spectabilis]|uniref:P-loop containing nucleoside triphosphate hydrolase protein n=1 Tax=Radiomyces spectabilis TaxID=64574 RepID=UPI00221E7D6B|nr:P-loop containing nucleoside triphosphate hydrolase protein [Radiomyces spectabilis]KAI8393431.1 P-loop containing nucleoside triphosphate hydrolase protein [Radiomyces spectabilis]